MSCKYGAFLFLFLYIKEGPMAHSAGIIAAALGKGRIPWFSGDIKVRHLR